VEWWQIALVLSGAVALGLAVGFGLNQVVVKFYFSPRNRRVSVPRLRPASIAPQQSAPVNSDPETLPPSVPDLFAEIEHNRRLASSEWTGQLESFVTKVWDSRGEEVHSLSAELRGELTEAYSDMALANSITWLSTEMSRRSPSLDESYTKLRASVAKRLNRVHDQLGESSTTSGSVSFQ
jgi:hypothetical protein